MKTEHTNSIVSVFPTSILTSNMNFNEDERGNLLKAVYDIYDNDERGKRKASENKKFGYTTFLSKINLNNDPRFAKLKDLIGQDLNSYINHINIDCSSQEVYLSEIWINIQAPGTYVAAHRHHNCIMTSVYYLQVGDGAGELIFIDAKESHYMILPEYSKETKYNAISVKITPREGLNIMFPSWLMHEVAHNLSNKDRIIIGFNYKIRKAAKLKDK